MICGSDEVWMRVPCGAGVHLRSVPAPRDCLERGRLHQWHGVMGHGRPAPVARGDGPALLNQEEYGFDYYEG